MWAYSPPGGLVSSSVVQSSEAWCTSVVVGKDMVPRMTLSTLGRLMDDMVVSLAFCRQGPRISPALINEAHVQSTLDSRHAHVSSESFTYDGSVAY